MEYAQITFWLVVIVFTALGVHRLWSSLVQPKVVNSILLPGTLVAQLGYVLGLLVTGGTVNNTTLIKDDDSGEPETGEDAKPRVPLIGTIFLWHAMYGADPTRQLSGYDFSAKERRPSIAPISPSSWD